MYGFESIFDLSHSTTYCGVILMGKDSKPFLICSSCIKPFAFLVVVEVEDLIEKMMGWGDMLNRINHFGKDDDVIKSWVFMNEQ